MLTWNDWVGVFWGGVYWTDIWLINFRTETTLLLKNLFCIHTLILLWICMIVFEIPVSLSITFSLTAWPSKLYLMQERMIVRDRQYKVKDYWPIHSLLRYEEKNRDHWWFQTFPHLMMSGWWFPKIPAFRHDTQGRIARSQKTCRKHASLPRSKETSS